MKKILKKIVATILIAFGSVIIYAIVGVIYAVPGSRFFPSWVNSIIYGGVFAIIYVWSTGWGGKQKDNQSSSEKKDLFKM